MNKQENSINEERKLAWQVAMIMSFVLLMGAGFVIGCFLLFLRPTESQLEKRELKKFPAFTVESFLSGEYTSQIDKWFSDTFPFRENLLTAEQRIQTAYGIRKDSVSNVGQGDEIDFDDLINKISSEEAASSTESSSRNESETAQTESTTAAAASETEEETTAGKTYEAVDGQAIAMMNPQEAGNVNVKDLVGYCVYGFNQPAADIYCQDVANVADALAGQCTVYDILIPDNSEVTLDAQTKAEWRLINEEQVIKYYQAKMASLSSNIVQVGIYDTLMEHNDQYLYFKTDHHWTQLGAYYAYVELCNEMGITAHRTAEYECIVTNNFLGSYYTSSGYTQLAQNPDTIVAYVPMATNELHFFDDTNQVMRTGKIVRDMNEFADTLKYYGFIYGDNSYEYIDNPELKNGKVCIVIKESFGNTFVPFLVDHYEKVIVVDYRGYKESVVQLAKAENATDIIFINNLEAISDVWTMNVLGNICQ